MFHCGKGPAFASAPGTPVPAGPTDRLREHQRLLEGDLRQPRDYELGDPVAVLDRVGNVGRDRVQRDHDFAAVVRIERAESRKNALPRQSAARTELGIQPRWHFHREAGGYDDRALPDDDGAAFEAGVNVVARGLFRRPERETCAWPKKLDANGLKHGRQDAPPEEGGQSRLPVDWLCKRSHYVATFFSELGRVRTIGVRQLKNEATQIVRTVKEQHALYVITVNGQPVATLRPYSDRDIAGMERGQAVSELQAIERLASAVGEAWLDAGSAGDGEEPAPARARREG